VLGQQVSKLEQLELAWARLELLLEQLVSELERLALTSARQEQLSV
jgi:hypothetical protein